MDAVAHGSIDRDNTTGADGSDTARKNSGRKRLLSAARSHVVIAEYAVHGCWPCAKQLGREGKLFGIVFAIKRDIAKMDREIWPGCGHHASRAVPIVNALWCTGGQVGVRDQCDTHRTRMT